MLLLLFQAADSRSKAPSALDSQPHSSAIILAWRPHGVKSFFTHAQRRHASKLLRRSRNRSSKPVPFFNWLVKEMVRCARKSALVSTVTLPLTASRVTHRFQENSVLHAPYGGGGLAMGRNCGNIIDSAGIARLHIPQGT